MISVRRIEEGELISDERHWFGYCWEDVAGPVHDWLWIALPWYARKPVRDPEFDCVRTGWHRLIVCWWAHEDGGASGVRTWRDWPFRTLAPAIHDGAMT